MALPFSQTLRSLSADRGRLDLPIQILLWLLLAAWLSWFVLAEVSVLEVSELARLEISRTALPIEAPVGGRVVAAHLTLDRELSPDSLLVQLDTEALSLQLKEQDAERIALNAEIAALRHERQLAEQTIAEMQAASAVAHDEAQAKRRQASIAARLATEDAERAARLHAAGQIALVERARQDAQAEQTESEEESLRLAADLEAAQSRIEETTHRAKLAELEREIARLSGQAAKAEVALERLRYEIDRRSIRTPIAGRLAETLAMVPGMELRQGDRLATVLPTGHLKIIADFPPQTALGRIRAGHKARIRLDGFPWAQYGSLTARVERVAGEPRYNRLRVELLLEAPTETSIPIEHGLTGTVEIEIERLSPAALVLRAAGGLLARHRGSP